MLSQDQKNIILHAVNNHKTPFYIYFENKILENANEFNTKFKKYFNDFMPMYAVKANSNHHIIKIIINQGFGLDCSSPYEAYLSKKLKVNGMYTSNYSSGIELREIAENHENLIINLDDIDYIDSIKEIGLKVLSFRINPSYLPKVSDELQFSGNDAKFGISESSILAAYIKAKESGIQHFGIHMMTGSNVLDEAYFKEIGKTLKKIALMLNSKLKINLSFINIGGGFGYDYEHKKILDLSLVAKNLWEELKELNNCLPVFPTLIVEPGRAIVVNSGALITTVTHIKRASKTLIGVDAGMNAFVRPAIYNAYHEIENISSLNSGYVRANIVGPLCQNNDQFARNRNIKESQEGDIIAIHDTGAYGYSMSHNFNNRLRPAELLVKSNGEIVTIRRAQTFSDLEKELVHV